MNTSGFGSPGKRVGFAASSGGSPSRGSPNRRGAFEDVTDTQSNMTGVTKMSPTKTMGGSLYGSGMPGALGGPMPFGGGIKAILAAAGVVPKSGLTIGSAALDKLG